jgi:hypothetical protein
VRWIMRLHSEMSGLCPWRRLLFGDDLARALFGYVGPSNTLKLVGTGDGGLEELKDEFNGGQVQYAYTRVTDPNTQTTKFVLFNWVGFAASCSRPCAAVLSRRNEIGCSSGNFIY